MSLTFYSKQSARTPLSAWKGGGGEAGLNAGVRWSSMTALAVQQSRPSFSFAGNQSGRPLLPERGVARLVKKSRGIGWKTLRSRAYLLLLIFFISACRRDARLFEGVIHYRHTLESCSPRYPVDFLMMNLDTASTYYYKNGNYKWMNKMALFQEDLYVAEENRNYFKVGRGDVWYGEGTDQDEDVVEFSMSRNQGKILGYKCDMLAVTTCKRLDKKIYTRYIFYSPEIKIDSSAFSRLRYFSHDFIAAKTHSLPLKIIMNTDEFAVTWEAVKIDFTALNDSIFHIPGMEDAQPVNRLSY